jgi:hypothetical protein
LLLYSIILAGYYIARKSWGSGITYDPKPAITFIASLGFYIEKLALPLDLNLLPEVSNNPAYWLFALLPAGLIWVLYSAKDRHGIFMTGWVLLGILPALFVIQTGAESLFGERYLYLASVGFSLALASWLGRIKNTRVLATCAATVLLVYAVGTQGRLMLWSDETALWRDTVEKSPRFTVAHLYYGSALIGKGQVKEGKKELMVMLGSKEAGFETQALVLKHLKAMSGSDAALLYDIKTAMGEGAAYYNLGLLNYAQSHDDNDKGQLENAIGYFRKAIAASPDFIMPHYYLGVCYLEQADWNKAADQMNLTAKLDFDGTYKERTANYLALIDEFRKRGL